MRWFILIVLLMLSGLSLLTLKSVAAELATLQFWFLGIGLAAYLISSRIPFSWWLRWRWLLYGGLVAALVATLVLGTVTRGSTRWIQVGSLSFQPSQFAVPFTSLALAGVITRYGLRRWWSVLVAGLVVMLPAGLILIEPDLGTTLILLLSMGVLFWVAGLPLRYLAMLAVGAVIVGVISWTAVLQPYQQARITSFFNAQDNQANYNAQQSLIAVGSGQFIGKGIGQGSQSHLRFLPERQTDFVFASFAEEWGFIGSSLVIGLYAALIGYLLANSTKVTQPAAQYVVVAIASLIALQTIINIGMNMGLLPITGVTLPFISYGGSSILATGVMLGLAQSALADQSPGSSTHIR